MVSQIENLKSLLSPFSKAFAFAILCLFFASLLSSQSGMDIFSAMMCLTALAWTAKYKKWSLIWPNLHLKYFWLLWLSVIALGLTLNPVKGSRLDLFFEFRWFIDLYVFVIFLGLFGEENKTLKMFSILLSFASLCAIVFYFMGFNPLTESPTAREANIAQGPFWRAGGLFDHSMPLAHSYAPILLVFAGLVLTNYRNKKLMLFIAPAVLLTAIALLLTFTRGVWIGAAIGIVTMGFLLNKRWGFMLIAATMVMAGSLFVLSPKIHNRVMMTVHMNHEGDKQRITLWKTNIEMFKDHPAVGIGYEQNKARLREYYDKTGIPAGYFEGHAHNQLIHFLSGTGGLGLSCYLAFVFIALRFSFLGLKLATSSTEKGITLGAIGAQVCFFIAGLTESNFSIGKNRFMLLFVIAWAISIYMKQNPTKHLNYKQ